MATKVDVIDLIDRHPVTGFQIGVLDPVHAGGGARRLRHPGDRLYGAGHRRIRSICRCRNSARSARAGLFGAAIGALSFGPLADLFGRKWFMIIAMVVFAIFSYLTSQSASLERILGLSLLLPASASAA